MTNKAIKITAVLVGIVTGTATASILLRQKIRKEKSQHFLDALKEYFSKDGKIKSAWISENTFSDQDFPKRKLYKGGLILESLKKEPDQRIDFLVDAKEGSIVKESKKILS